ncbi:PEGA domain-containing protein, partial [Myxococcota bacterium]|nr:PEGA domain-containing protein [Myxococcota bacterium]
AAQGTAAAQGTTAVQPATGVAQAEPKTGAETEARGTQSATPQPRTDRRPATEAQPRDVPEPPSKTVNLTVESTPSGATVWLEDKQAGTTPFTMSVPRDETLTFVFKKPGYEDVSRIVVTAKDRTLSAELAKAPEPKAVETGRTDAAPAKTTPATKSVGTKPKTETKPDPSKLDEKVDDLK